MSQSATRAAIGDADLPEPRTSTVATNVSSALKRPDIQVYCLDSNQIVPLHLGAFDGSRTAVIRANAVLYKNKVIVLHVNSLCCQVPC